MRLPLALALVVATPAHTWEATSGAVCILAHETPEASVELTYNPVLPLYSITLTRKTNPWTRGPVFEMRFDGPRGLTISTGRHSLAEDNTALTVTDTGFGNVLNGLEFNRTATALLADQTLTIPLDGAAGPVADFRACTEAATT